jgi:mannitol/fructose-specific phosphotransferase system IIA component (Ntr-type)/CheY-like chemotaxis protein
VTREVTGRGAKKPFKNREFFSSLRRAAIVGTVIEPDNFALVPKPPSAIEKAEPGAKRVLSSMVADTLALVKREQLSKPRIILVNDSPDTVHLMEALIYDWFKEATLLIFQSGEQAWQELEQQDPDILITDMMRGNDPMDGWAMIPLLIERKVKYPVVVVSACREFPPQNNAEYASLLQHARQTLNIAAVAIPFDFEQLRKVLEACLEKTNVKPPVAASYPVSILFSAEHIIPNLKAHERFVVIREMVTHLISIGQIRAQDEEVVVNALITREKKMSTGFGFGCASPRARVDCVKDIVFAVGVYASGVEFQALDNQPVNIFALFIAPANSQSHEAELLRFGAEIAKTLSKTAVRRQLLHSNSAAEMWSILKPVYDDALQAES